ncbi:MAG: ATP-binding protein [Rhodocyclaceae bacterium]|nr:ATP-binding protein [Rhodocyclaceae bacterium]
MTSSHHLRGLLIIGLIGANALVFALSGYSLYQGRKQHELRAEMLTQNIAGAVDQSVANSIEKIDLSLRMVADEMERQLAGKGLDERFMTALLERFEQRLPDVENLRVVDAEGLIILGSRVSRKDRISVADRDYFTHHRGHADGGLHISKPMVGRVLKKYLIPFVRRYNRPDGSFGGVVFATISEDHFTQLLSRFNLGRYGTVILRDADFGLITRIPAIPDQQAGKIGDKGVSPEFRKLVGTGATSATYYLTNSPDGFERVLSYRRLVGAPMMIIVGMASQDYLAGWRIEAWKTGTLAFSFLLLSVLMGSIQLRLLARSERREQAAQAANLAKSQFLAAMSHEIRTPMNGILGMAQLLLLPRLTDEERCEYSRTILNSGQTLLALLNDILDLSKVEAGKLELAHDAFSPPQIVSESASLFVELAHAKGLKLDSAWIGPEGQRYRADPLRLRQMLSNLISNAIKFTGTGFVRVEAAETERNESEAVLEFSVTDSGMGIPPEKQSLLFQAFSQADRSTARDFGGTGLGLSIVRDMASLMGGSVGVESEEGRGSRFWFRIRTQIIQETEESRHLPRLPVEELPVPGEQGPARPILVVEDNAVNRRVIEALLGKLSLPVESVENGQLAVDAITRGMRPALVLMDVQMPVLDGLRTTEQIRRWEQETLQPRLTIIALTAGAFEEDRLDCVAVGMDDFLTKPLNMNELTSVLAKWMDRPLPDPD